MREHLAIVLLLAPLAAGPAHGRAQWAWNDQGECARVWTADELARGPVAMANGVILPFRMLAGGLTDGTWGVVLSPFAAVAGVSEGVGWVCAGLLDTLTGGAFAIAPDGMARLRGEPLLQFPEGHRAYEAYTESRCTGEPSPGERTGVMGTTSE